MSNNKPQILLTNDDGIESPGLWEAAESLSQIGYVWVVAPREQSSSTGRSMPPSSDGIITTKKLNIHEKEWTIYAVGGTPAQTVQHGILEIMKSKPDLIVSGINYGLNLGTGITISGTIGAAIEGASHNIPSLAVSLETDSSLHHTHSTEVEFSTAGFFTSYFANAMLNNQISNEVKVIKVDIPHDATPDTPWEITKLAEQRYYLPKAPVRESWDVPETMGYKIKKDVSMFQKNSDVYTVISKKLVSVTPLMLDMTARIDFKEFKSDLQNNN